MKRATLLLAGFLASLVTQAAHADEWDRLRAATAQLKPGAWVELSGTEIRPILSKRADVPFNGGVVGAKSVVSTTSGAAFDGKRWYVHGGGHTDYSGNEVYVFDFTTLAWTRATAPSAMHPASESVRCPDTVDNTPRASQTRDGLVFSPKTGTVWLFASGYYCPKGDSNDRDAWEFDPAAKKWQKRIADLPRGPYTTALDTRTGNIILIDTLRVNLLDPVTRAMKPPAPRDVRVDSGNAEYDPKRDQVWILSNKTLVRLSKDDSGNLSKATKVADIQPINGGVAPYGIAYHPGTDRMLLWDGGRKVVAVAPESGEWTVIQNPVGPAPTHTPDRVFGRWVYLPAIDAFAGYNNVDEGVWLYRLPTGPQPQRTPVSGLRRLCPQTNYDAECDYTNLAHAFADTRDGETVTLRAGVYRSAAVLRAHGVTIKGEPGAHIRDRGIEGKAALIIRGNDTTITGLECSHIQLQSNGACIRQEGRNLTLRNMFIHHTEMGILTGDNVGSVVIEDSRFEDSVGSRSFLGHSIYIGATEELIVRRTQVLRSGGRGHGIKSRARNTLIEDSVVASLEATQSRLIDISEGGNIIVRRNLLQQGPNADNDDLIGIALERLPEGVRHSTLIEKNTAVCDRSMCLLVRHKSPADVAVRGNRMVGHIVASGFGNSVSTADNSWSLGRTTAGMPAFPALPR